MFLVQLFILYIYITPLTFKSKTFRTKAPRRRRLRCKLIRSFKTLTTCTAFKLLYVRTLVYRFDRASTFSNVRKKILKHQRSDRTRKECKTLLLKVVVVRRRCMSLTHTHTRTSNDTVLSFWLQTPLRICVRVCVCVAL